MSKLISKKAELIKITSNLKKRKRKIVLVHGVFDLIHMGHLEYFSQAKKYGDILIVSVTAVTLPAVAAKTCSLLSGVES